MKNFLLSEVIEATGGKIKSPARIKSFTGISIDSRKIKHGELFIALKGEKFDGHAFISDSINSGARGIVYSKKRYIGKTITSSGEVVFIEVKDTLKALHDLALFYRKKFSIPLIAVTGSNGKTTVKEMIDSILSQKSKTIKNPGNFNNHIGLPLSLLPLDREHQIAIVEMGMSKPGEIKKLCKVAMPTVGVITNISLAHAENFKSIEEIAKAKAVAIINGDDQNLIKAIKNYRGKKILFGKGLVNEVRAGEIQDKGLKIDFTLHLWERKIDVCMSLIGEHNIYNALAASACSYYFGVSPEEIKKGLEAYKGIRLRMEVIKTPQGINILNDSYNANPSSMLKALEGFSKIPVSGKRILLLGDMLELGKFTLPSHREIGSIIGKGGYDFLFTVGELAKNIALSAIKEGMPKDRVKSFANSKQVIKPLKELLSCGDWLLVKGSRSVKLDEVADEISGEKKT